MPPLSKARARSRKAGRVAAERLVKLLLARLLIAPGSAAEETDALQERKSPALEADA